METTNHIETVAYHQTQCLQTIADIKIMMKGDYNEEDAIGKLKDLQQELTHLTVQLRQMEEALV